MFGYRFLRSAAVALGLYGLLGLFIAAAMLVVGSTTFSQVTTLQKTLEMLRLLRANPNEMARLAPEAVHIFNTFSGYARRAESALARYDLKRAEGPAHELV